jgi:quercetin dioxygenase-like cupin family protein
MPFVELSSLTEHERVPGFRGRFVHTENVTFAHWRIEKGAALPSHAHPHEQITALVEGELEFTLDGETRTLKPGIVALIPAMAGHSGKARTDCTVIDVFYPVREDYR